MIRTAVTGFPEADGFVDQETEDQGDHERVHQHRARRDRLALCPAQLHDALRRQRQQVVVVQPAERAGQHTGERKVVFRQQQHIAERQHVGNRRLLDQHAISGIGNLEHIHLEVPANVTWPPAVYATEKQGPAQISRDNIRRRILLECNVRGRDMGGFVADARRLAGEKFVLPGGTKEGLKMLPEFKYASE